jgi:hypothetical protein
MRRCEYQHSYIDFSLPFESYQRKFSSKTRSTQSKVRKYAGRWWDHPFGRLIPAAGRKWKISSGPPEHQYQSCYQNAFWMRASLTPEISPTQYPLATKSYKGIYFV